MIFTPQQTILSYVFALVMTVLFVATRFIDARRDRQRQEQKRKLKLQFGEEQRQLRERMDAEQRERKERMEAEQREAQRQLITGVVSDELEKQREFYEGLLTKQAEQFRLMLDEPQDVKPKAITKPMKEDFEWAYGNMIANRLTLREAFNAWRNAYPDRNGSLEDPWSSFKNAMKARGKNDPIYLDLSRKDPG